jgi:hypothetical protein
MLSFYLSEEVSLKTAFLECNKHYDLRLIEEAYEWQKREKGTFSFHNITCHKGVTSAQIPHIFGEDYEALVLDFGTDFVANREEFLRCDLKIVIGGASAWDLQKLEQFAREAEQLKGNESWFYFIPKGNEKIVAKLRGEIRRKVWSVPMVCDPVITTNSSSRFFKSILDF